MSFTPSTVRKFLPQPDKEVRCFQALVGDVLDPTKK